MKLGDKEGVSDLNVIGNRNTVSNVNIADLVERFGIMLIFVLLFIVASIISPAFLGVNNLLNVARQVSIVGIISMGMTLVIITGGIDLSVGPVMACATLLVAGLQGYGPIVSLVVPILFGFIAGICNGLLVTKFKLQPFIVTLGTSSIFIGIGLIYSGGHPIIGVPKALSFIGQGKIGGHIPIQAVIFVLVSVIIGIMLKYTPFGRYTYSIGGNAEASRLSGISVEKVTLFIYGISGLLCGIAGIIMATHLNVGEASLGDKMEMDAIAAAAVGGTSMQGGKGTVVGTITGVLIIGVLSNLLNLLNVPGYAQNLFKGAIIIGACILQGIQTKKA